MVGILCWDGSLAALVLPRGRPTLRFAAGWAEGAPIGVGTLGLFLYVTI